MKSKSFIGHTIIWQLIPVVVLTTLLPVLNHRIPSIDFWPSVPTLISKHIGYQSITLGLSLVPLLVLAKLRPEVFKMHFRKGQIDASVIPVPQVGIKPKAGQNWKQLGLNFAIVISIITGLVMYLGNPKIDFSKLLTYLPFALGIALVNSFVEEMITRLGIVVILKDHLPDSCIALISGALFGFVHFWGTPGGIGGVLLAGFLGWLLAKTILETKGIFWAWCIHFLQDVIILSVLFSQI